MTTGKGMVPRAAASSTQLPALRPVAMPPAVTDLARVDDFRNQVWVPRKLRPGEKAVLEATGSELAHRDVPCPENSIRFHIGKTLTHWDSGRLSDAAKDAVMSDWMFALRDFSESHIAEACAHWVSESRYKPVPADIVALVRNYEARDRESARRIRVLLGLEQPRKWEVVPEKPKPAADRPVGGMLASLARRLTAPAAAPPRRDDIRSSLAADRDPAAVARLKAMRKDDDEKAAP